jgi:hypothetical protein
MREREREDERSSVRLPHTPSAREREGERSSVRIPRTTRERERERQRQRQRQRQRHRERERDRERDRGRWRGRGETHTWHRPSSAAKLLLRTGCSCRDVASQLVLPERISFYHHHGEGKAICLDDPAEMPIFGLKLARVESQLGVDR